MDTIARILDTATAMRGYPGVDEPLIINDSEVATIADFVLKKQNPTCKVDRASMEIYVRMGTVAVFGRRVHVIT